MGGAERSANATAKTTAENIETFIVEAAAEPIADHFLNSIDRAARLMALRFCQAKIEPMSLRNEHLSGQFY